MLTCGFLREPLFFSHDTLVSVHPIHRPHGFLHFRVNVIITRVSQTINCIFVDGSSQLGNDLYETMSKNVANSGEAFVQKRDNGRKPVLEVILRVKTTFVVLTDNLIEVLLEG